jgi:hypothetical protein
VDRFQIISAEMMCEAFKYSIGGNAVKQCSQSKKRLVSEASSLSLVTRSPILQDAAARLAYLVLLPLRNMCRTLSNLGGNAVKQGSQSKKRPVSEASALSLVTRTAQPFLDILQTERRHI